MDISKETDSTVGDRRGLTNRTAFVRIVAMIGFVLFLLVVIVANLFYGFTGTLERLLLLSIGHLLLAPLAFFATLRLGMLVTGALILASVQLLLDTIQLVIRAFRAELTVEFVVLLAANIALAAVSLLYILALVRLRQADYELNNGIVDGDKQEKRAAMIRQESNALRVIAIFDVFLLLAVLLFLLVLGDFSVAMHMWSLLYLGHFVVLGFALFGAPNGYTWLIIFVFFVLVQTAADLLQFTLRLLDRPDLTLEVLSFANIVTTTLLIIAAAYIVIDIAYLVSAFGLVSAIDMNIDARLERTESQAVESKARAHSQTAATSGDGAFQMPDEIPGGLVMRRRQHSK